MIIIEKYDGEKLWRKKLSHSMVKILLNIKLLLEVEWKQSNMI